MKTEETKLDKSNWGDGPWQSEPDRKEWKDPETGLPCMAIRSHHGNWCGYVGVPNNHPAYGKSYDDVPVEVHGGLTYANKCQGHICHVPEPGEPDDVYWLGFACGHAFSGKLRPARVVWEGHEDIYRDLPYVENEITSLAKQLAAIT